MHPKAHDLMGRFPGYRHAYGIYNISNNARSQGKVKGRVKTIAKEVTVDLYSEHLLGKIGLGIVPIMEDNSCRFGAIDVDDYGIDPASTQNAINNEGLPLVACTTKSGGLHLYLFLSTPAPASLVQERLRSMAALLGFGGSEIFPKQSRILAEEGDAGSWINLPYQNEEKTVRYALDGNARRLDLLGFLKYSTTKELTAEQLEAISSDPEETIRGAPICINRMLVRGKGKLPEGMRNDGLMQMGTLAKRMSPDNWEALIEDFNNKYAGLASTEVLGMIRSHKKKEYKYACNKLPFTSFCDKIACAACKYGVKGDRGLPKFGSLSKLMTSPPLWFIDIEDADERVMVTTAELENFRLFRKRIMEVLTVYPRMMKGEEWDEIVERLMEGCNEIQVPPEATKKGMLWQHLEDFCLQNAETETIDCVLRGQVWTADYSDRNQEEHYFRLTDFMNYLKRQDFEDMNRNFITAVLKERGALHKFFRINQRGANLWIVPVFKGQDRPFEIPGGDPDEPF